ncbi:MAG: carboxylate--amine ligase [Ktedonobacteraceae bacterium]|nr:carboxylate--amine ligase [Ktedonobacteraceae bacterium]
MLTTSELSSMLRDQINSFALPAAVIFNSHITGLAVARSLGRRGVPVIALDRDAAGYALTSKYVTAAALCPNVLEDEAGFIDFLLALGRELKRPAVLFPCNDEWVLTVNRHRAALEKYFLFPFSGPEVVEPVLDKARLYQRATELGIPIPRTWYLHPDTIEQIAAELPYPCIVKPTEQRAFYDAFQDKAWRIGEPADLFSAVERASGHLLVAQEIVGQGLSDFYSVCSYIGKAGGEHGGDDASGKKRDGVFVGRKLEQYPPQFGTGCLVVAEWVPSIAERGMQILKTFGYSGVSEVEFIYDERDDEYKLLDINTRVWKWIGLPIAAGVDLPWLAYSDAIGRPASTEQPRDGLIWTYAKDYMALRQAGLGKATAHYVPEALWAELIAGQAEHIVDAVIDPDDPMPAARMLHNTLNPRPYFCAC